MNNPRQHQHQKDQTHQANPGGGPQGLALSPPNPYPLQAITADTSPLTPAHPATSPIQRAIFGAIAAPAVPIIQRQVSSPTHQGIIQRARPVGDVLNVIDQNPGATQNIGGLALRRIMYWNSQGRFDTNTGGKLTPKSLARAVNHKIPAETDPNNEQGLPDFMDLRGPFSVKLPNELGGRRIWFRKKTYNVVFQGRGWISDNAYFRPPAGNPRPRYMVHVILEWNGNTPAEDEPNPHITIRNAETQANIDLDAVDGGNRVQGLEGTHTSMSTGVGVYRNPGQTFNDHPATRNFVQSPAVQAWLTNDVVDAAQAAL